jgi:hypothetical protein
MWGDFLKGDRGRGESPSGEKGVSRPEKDEMVIG